MPYQEHLHPGSTSILASSNSSLQVIFDKVQSETFAEGADSSFSTVDPPLDLLYLVPTNLTSRHEWRPRLVEGLRDRGPRTRNHLFGNRLLD